MKHSAYPGLPESGNTSGLFSIEYEELPLAFLEWDWRFCACAKVEG